MADNGENILVEFDYDNIALIDPNKLVDQEGNVKDRLVKQEDLIFYANLECNVLPRTKLAVGSAMNDQQRTISVGKINFLNPGHKKFLDTAWSDELTGKNTLQGQGVNQPKLTSVKNPNKSDDYYITQNLWSNGQPGAVDNGFLGITNIRFSLGTDFLPVIDIELQDVKGRALFEGGNNSPYSAFFQLPYPQFTLTMKGYYGKAVKFPIMLQSFTSKFNASTHNFDITLKFYGYKYTLLSYVNFGSLMAVPHMYNNVVNLAAAGKTQGSQTKEESIQRPQIVSRGYQKMKEIYSDYKSKGLIPDNFPELTLNQLNFRLQKFIDNVLNDFAKENLGVLTEMTNYTNALTLYQQKVFLYGSSWFNTYMDTKVPIVLNSGQNLYIFKTEYDAQKRETAITELNGIILENNKKLNENSVFGEKGSYTVGTKVVQSKISVPIDIKTFTKKELITNVDIEKSFRNVPNSPKGQLSPANTPITNLTATDIAYQTYKKTLEELFKLNDGIFYFFEGPKSFMSITDNIGKSAQKFRTQIEQQITENLASKFNSQGEGSLGFTPSIRNILAVFYCQGEAFLRLMDEVHKKAWEQRENPYRKAAIFGNQTTAPSVDIKGSTQNNEPIYPWPQVIQETVGDDNQEKFQIIYPGAQNVANSYRAYNPEIWPEVEFVEQFIKGYTQRQNDADKSGAEFNELDSQPSRISLNGIDFPISNEVFQNKEESKYFYEIYERIILNSYFSRLNRKSGYDLSIYEAEGDDEAVNILKSLGQDNPFLAKTIKEYLLDSNNYVPFLRHISNQGQGESWQSFIRGQFVTNYIKNDVENPNVLFNEDIIISTKSQPNVSLSNPKNITNLAKYFENSSISNTFEFGDTYPITDLKWDRKNLADGKSLNNANEAFDTQKVLNYNTVQLTITNFTEDNDDNEVRPFTHFNFLNLNVNPNISNLKSFYENRQLKDQLITEGNILYENYSENITQTQTTSMLNTPYFINAIQQGVFNFRYKQNDPYPYKTAAYLFLNSLPLGTLREKYKTFDGQATTDLSYILATMKKFGAVHKLPYAWILKYGSIWHRYKIYDKTGKDFIDDVWKDFNYLENWDPGFSSSTKTYNLNIDGNQKNLVLQQTTGNQPFTDMTTGFYPQTLDDFNVFLQGLKLFSGKTQVSGIAKTQSITGNCDVFTVTGTCSSSGNVLSVSSITKNLIAVGDQLKITIGNTIINLIVNSFGPNTSGGTGTYNITPGLTSNVTNFILNSYVSVSGLTLNSLGTGSILSGSTINPAITIQTQYSGPSNSNGVYKLNTYTANTTTSDFRVLNPPLQVDQIDSNVLTQGQIINGPNFNGDITIISQISGTTGGNGIYLISSNQVDSVTSPFVVQNQYIQGISSTSIQPLLDDKKLIMFNTLDSTIYGSIGFDPSNNSRTMRISPYSVVVRTTDTTGYYVLPSFGTNINQAKDETFKNGNMKKELFNNPSMFNGTVRLFWNAPQYGWFNNSQVKKNNPITYLKQILNEQKDQQNFLITGKQNDYTNFEELFTTFDIKTLDLFESEFLNFSRSIYDYVDTLPPTTNSESLTQLNVMKNQDGSYTQVSDNQPNFKTIVGDQTYKNFQGLMRQLLKIQTPTGTSPETKLTEIIASQNSQFQQVLSGFMNYDTVFKFGNPTQFNRRLYLTFSTRFLEDPFIYGPYENGTLPPQVSVSASQQQSPETWKKLLYYVGTSSIPELEYKNNGSYITDFFIDMNVQFNEKNVQDFAPIIKLYASEKLKKNNLNLTSFYNLMDSYIIESDNYIGNVINVMLPQVRKNLPTVLINQELAENRANLEAGFTEQTRTELWETFKALNDTWIAGFDFQNKTLFEDVMLVDRASRNVGDKIIVDIFQIQDLIKDGSYKNTLLDMITTILVQNNFQYFMLPSFVNFYNVQDTQKNPTPRPDGTLEFGNTLFGTFLNVDYRDSSPKFLCYYSNKPSEHLDMKDNIDYRYRDDAFDLRRASDNPLQENQAYKEDWDKSNKVVGFNVDVTRPNQQIFKSFSVNQTPGKPTAESLEMLNQMANLGGNRRSTTQSVSLYNLYKNRSYECSVEMMGCALIQPLMYFNIRNVPMFSGPYMITKITHDITEDNFTTHFQGTRQPFYALPKIDNFLQTLNIKILNTIQTRIQQNEKKERESSKNVLAQKDNILSNITSEETLTKNQDCVENINPRYRNYTGLDTPQSTTQTIKELFEQIKKQLIASGFSATGGTTAIVANIAFSFVYVDSGKENGIFSYEHNYNTINLKEIYGPNFINYIKKNYFCVTRGTNSNLPIASFNSFEDFVKFLVDKTIPILTLLKAEQNNFDFNTSEGVSSAIAKMYVLHYPIEQPDNVYTTLTEQEKLNLTNEFIKANNAFITVQTFTIT